MAERPRAAIGSFTTGPMAIITVGPASTRFQLHKDLLINKCPTFFAPALDGSFREAQELAIDLPEDDPKAFVLFVDWLYSGRLPTIPNEPKWYKLGTENHISAGLLEAEQTYHILYYMAEKWCLEILRDRIIDRIRKFHDETKTTVHPDLIIAGYRNTSERSVLREYLCRAAAYEVSINARSLAVLRSAIATEEPGILVDILAFFERFGHLEGMENPDDAGGYDFHVASRKQGPPPRYEARRPGREAVEKAGLSEEEEEEEARMDAWFDGSA
ncbi:hypothetical protein MMC30_002134 [Trapelia coarctata]|nr:hypothetical protein [Trapelia coarctata]